MMDTTSTDLDWRNETSSNPIKENACLNETSIDSFRACIRDQILGHLRYMHPTQADIFTFIYVCISVLGILGNGLVIMAVVRRSQMRTTRNVFIVSLACSNFLLAIILVPFLWLPTYRIEFPYGAFVCKSAQAFPSTNIFCSTLTVSAIAVDRYFAVVRTRIGPGVMKTVPATLIALAIWVLSFSLSILYLLHFNIKDYVLPGEYVPLHLSGHSNPHNILLFQRCELQPRSCLEMEDSSDFDGAKLCYKYYETAVSGIMALFIYFVPMPILVIFSLLLTAFLAKNERQQSVLRQRVTPSKAMLASIGSTDASAKSPSILIGPTRKKSSTSTPSAAASTRSGNSRRSRTTALLFAMAFSNALLWLPFTVISMFIQLGPSELTKHYDYELRQLDDAAKLISMLSICINPFLYGFLNTNFQQEFKLIFQASCPCFRKTKCSKESVALLAATGTGASNRRDVENSVIVYMNGDRAIRKITR